MSKSKIKQPRKPEMRPKIQLPMHCQKYPRWQALMNDRIALEVEQRLAAEASRDTGERLDRTDVRTVVSLLFPDHEHLFAFAMRRHMERFGRIANAEAGFDLGLRPETVVIGMPNGYAVPFATIDEGARKRLLRFAGVRQVHEALMRRRSERYEDLEVTPNEFVEEEANMDLLTAALPYVAVSMAAYPPSKIVDRAVSYVAENFERMGAPLRGLPKMRTAPRRPKRGVREPSKALH